MQNGFLKNNLVAFVALLLAAAGLGVGFLALKGKGADKQIAFVDTQRLMSGFKEAILINKDVEAEDAKWRGALKAMEDSLKAYMDSMTVQYDKSDARTKKEMQDLLSARSQQVNNFERVSTQKMQAMSREKLTKVYQKVDAFMRVYGKSKGYDIIFGTVQGSIIYGEGTAADITHDVIEAINKHYE